MQRDYHGEVAKQPRTNLGAANTHIGKEKWPA